MLSRLFEPIRNAGWLNAARVLAYSRLFVVILFFAALGWIALSKGLIDPVGHPLGTDFLNVYAAGLLADAGRAAAAYDWPTHRAIEASIVAYDGYYGWHYPPMFLFLAVPLALMPYAVALVVYLALTFAAYLWAIARLVGSLPGRFWLAAGFPAVFVNLGHGQNGFLTTALLAGGLTCLTARPWLGGMLLGCLAYKPQFAVLLPVALLMGGYWPAVIVAGLTAAVISLASGLAFGIATWHAFFGSLEPTRTIILEQGATGWEKIVSVFSAVRMLGGGIPLAYGVQSLVTVTVMGVVGLVWWRSRRIGVSIGCLALAIPLTTPYVLDYDLMVLAVAVFVLAREGIETGFRPWEKSTLAIVTLTPLLARGIGAALHLPIVPPVLLVALALFAARELARPAEMLRRVATVTE